MSRIIPKQFVADKRLGGTAQPDDLTANNLRCSNWLCSTYLFTIYPSCRQPERITDFLCYLSPLLFERTYCIRRRLLCFVIVATPPRKCTAIFDLPFHFFLFLYIHPTLFSLFVSPAIAWIHGTQPHW